MATQRKPKPQVGIRPADDPEPGLQYKHRGIYEDERFTAPRILFVLIRLVLTAITYSILVNRNSPFSLFNYLPNAFYPSSASSGTPAELSLPFISEKAMESLSFTLDMPLTSALVFLMTTGIGIQFCVYALIWRRELFPLSGDGSAIATAAVSSVIDLIHVLIYFYFSQRNPTWTIPLFRWLPLLFTVGLSIQFTADQQKHMFKEDPRRQGQVLQTGLWGLVRAPNYSGFLMWRLAQSLGTMGWLLGSAFVYMNLVAYRDNSLPSIDQHMTRKYGRQYDDYKRRVPYKMIPWMY